MMSTETRSVMDRVKAHATDKGWTYKGPNHLNKLMDTCTMACDRGHVWQAPAASFLFPPHSGCPECTRIALKPTPKAPAKKGVNRRPPGSHQGFTFSLDEVNERLKPRNIVLVGAWEGSKKTNTFRCLTCEGTWQDLGTAQLAQKAPCPYCGIRSTKSQHVLLTAPTAR